MLPAGYLMDSGALYDQSRGYGWTLKPKSTESNVNLDQRLDTYVYVTNTATATWNYTLPPGNYLVTVVVGSPIYTGVHTVAVEGVTVIKAAPTGSGQFVELLDYPATVSDGQLTITIGGSGDDKKTKLCYLIIKPAT